jgi:hypothetical protein
MPKKFYEIDPWCHAKLGLTCVTYIVNVVINEFGLSGYLY